MTIDRGPGIVVERCASRYQGSSILKIRKPAWKGKGQKKNFPTQLDKAFVVVLITDMFKLPSVLLLAYRLGARESN